MRCLLISIVTILLSTGAAMAIAPVPPKDSAVDHAYPRNVLDAVFLAARTSNPKLLQGLCDPKGQGDGDTKAICELTLKHPRWTDFKRNFEKGVRISRVARLQGDKARLNFLFGTDGRKPEEMVLIQRDGRWYLHSF